MSNSQPLNPQTLPLSGRGLIEASAGTGKTYTISGLYLRLLLGHGGQNPMTCEQILVVTFTNAATEELRDRIRNRIRLAYQAFLGLPCDDTFIIDILSDINEAEKSIALRRLDLALKSLDEAAIYTIHGFCQRILTDMAFESSLLFETEFTIDDSEYLHHAVRDYWRQSCYPLDSTLAHVVQSEFSDPDALLRQIRPLLNSQNSQAVITPEAFNTLTTKLTQSLTEFKTRWKSEHNGALKQLKALPLNGARFGKAADDFPKLDMMFQRLGDWIKFGTGLPPKDEMDKLALSNIKLNKGGELPHPKQAKLLAHIERLNELIKTLKPAFLYQALAEIRVNFVQQKQLKNVLTPDDLLTQLSYAIEHNADVLPQQIRERFPVAMIDEFQDTDPLQFDIFSAIYPQSHPRTNDKAHANNALLMIGDPKQAIYAFRGADIHTYIEAREQTQAHYHLATNYRSSQAMVTGVNALFALSDDPFISEAIKFEKVGTPASAANKKLNDEDDNSAALRLRLLSEEDGKGLNKTTARKVFAEDTAAEIVRLLSASTDGDCDINGKPLQAKDIAILVRDRNEAAVIKQSLTSRNIGAVFLSRDSVFSSIEAFELVTILRSLADPKNERNLRNALATQLLGYHAQKIHQFNVDENLRQQLLEQFFNLHQLWLKKGIIPALLSLANETQLVNRLLKQQNGERRLTDFRHLAELLQQKSTELDGISALLSWFEQQLITTSSGDEQQLRLESEQNLVQIVTIHKSKGLEYPICFVPFVSLARDNRRRPAPMMYHKNGQLLWDIEQTDEGWDLQKQETLAEDLRLLYVALTRPVYRCYLGIANHSRFTKKSGLTSQLHETAIGYLLGIRDKQCDFTLIEQQANTLTNEAICSEQIIANAIDTTQLAQTSQDSVALEAKTLDRIMLTPWRVGSYSGLVRNMSHARVLPGIDDEGLGLAETFCETDVTQPVLNSMTKLDRFNFEKGANAGSFLHLVLELIDFTNAKADLEKHLPDAMKQYGIEDIWLTPLMEWYLDLLGAPLRPAPQQWDGLSLYKLANQQKLVEMEFYLPIKTLSAKNLNQTLIDFGYGDNLDFDNLKGMLKGFIDLVFEHDGKYYIADYKSNHLGDDFDCYGTRAMSQTMLDHRYDLQFILYSLALHRYLQTRITNYDYDTHFGGCYYLFLRGMSANNPTTGVFYDRPPTKLIQRLDQLFEGNITQASSEEAAQ
ncbi:MAG: exodeoxyribonuclease V subunit beta [Parashewanella sp.]